MEAVSLRRFDVAHRKLGSADQIAVKKALALLVDNPRHPSLRVRKMRTVESLWEASPSRRLRVAFEIVQDTIILHNVGGHEILKRP